MAYMYFNNSKMAKYTFVIKYYILFVFFVNSRFNCSSVNRDFVPANLEYSTNAISNVQTKIISSFIRKIWTREAQIDYYVDIKFSFRNIHYRAVSLPLAIQMVE